MREQRKRSGLNAERAPIRVLHFAHIINRYDIIDTVLTRLDPKKFEVAALTGTPARHIDDNAQYPLRVLNFDFNRRNYARMLVALVQEIRRFRPHILQAHHYDENIVSSIAVRLARVPCYINGRHYSDLIYQLTDGLKRKMLLAAEAICNKTATRITVPTDEVARILTEIQGVPRAKVTVIPFGVDFNRYRPSSIGALSRLRHEYNLADKYMTLACGRLNKEKGLEYLLQAIPEIRSRNRDFRLVVVGKGPDEVRLRELTRKLEIENVVQFVGWRDDVLDWIAAADLVVHPSLSESFCQVLLESLAFGKPIVMTPVGAAPEVIGNNERGRIVPKGDGRAIVSAVCELMSDRELGRRLGEAGEAYVRLHMSAERTARRYEDLYETILNRRTSSSIN